MASTIAAVLAFVSAAPAATIGFHFLAQANNGGTNGNALAPTDSAGAAAYAQVNWNNFTGALGTNMALIDSSGAASGVGVSWSSPNIWSQTGNTSPNQGNPDANLMNPYLDNNGNANVAISGSYNMFSTAVPVNNNRNWPLIYLTNMVAWMASQSAAAYDVVIYFDGDNNGGRTGEYWPVSASGDPTALTLGADLSTHVFGCDLNNFIGGSQTYSEVLSSIQTGAVPNFSGGQLAEYGNFPGNYTVIKSLTNDTVLFRTQRFNSRAPINAVQIIPRGTVLPGTIYSLFDAPVYAGGKAVFAPVVAGATPMTLQWQKGGISLTDGGNIFGSTTSTLTVSNVSAPDVASYTLVVSNALGVITSAPAALTIVTPAANSFTKKIVTNAPYAFWRFNETLDASTGFAPAYDSIGGFTATYGKFSQNGFNGVVGPQPTDWPGLESGNLAYQSSRGTATSRQSYLIAPPLNLFTNTVTMCAWIYPTAAQGGFTALLATRSGNDVAAFGYGNNNYLGYTWNSNNAATYNFQSFLIPLTNVWSFVALTISPTNAVLYCYNTNGQFSATNAIAHSIEGCTGPTFIGGDVLGASIAAPYGRSFVGSIDELAIFNRTLPQTEIYNLFKKGLGLDAIPPTIPQQPVSLALYEGRTATFNITASGDTPLNYQWRKNGVGMSNGGNTNGVNTPSLTINNVSIANENASYDVVVGNIVNSITSSVATLTVVVSNSTPIPYEAKLRNLNPIAYWRLNETNGSPYSYDYWGGNIAVNEGSVTLGATGPQPPDFSGIETTNTAGSYDGLTADTASSVSLINNRPAFSIIGWFNTAGTIGTRIGLFGQNDVAEFGFHGLGPDNQAQLGFWTPRGAAFLNQSTNVYPNVWYLVAAVATGTNVNLLLASTNGAGGIQVAQSITSHAATTNYGNSVDPFRMAGGGILDPTGNYFDGLVDEVAVFGRALSLDEISGLFGAALSGGDLPPTITAQPTSRAVYQSQNATFSVSALGTGPLIYQWRTNGVPLPNGGNVSGATSASISITNAAAANAGNYDVVISNHVNSVTSSVATLTVTTPTTAYESALIALTPVAYYRLNEFGDPTTNAIANDYWGGNNGVYGAGSQNGFNGIFGPVPPNFTFEANNYALSTIAATANSYATAPFGSLSTNTVTMCMWVNPTGTFDTYSGLLMNRNSGIGGGFGFVGPTAGQLGYTWNNNSGATWGFQSGLVPPLNTWSFVALIVSPTNAIIYMANSSGIFSATNTLAHTADVFGNLWRIGQDANDGVAATTRIFNGLIDEVAVFNYDLSLSQLQTLYTTGGGLIPVSLSIVPSGNNVVVTWPNGTLLEATNLSGPWNTNLASSPYTVPATNAQTFYRVRVR